jgi:hypothetical protein
MLVQGWQCMLLVLIVQDVHRDILALNPLFKLEHTIGHKVIRVISHHDIREFQNGD